MRGLLLHFAARVWCVAVRNYVIHPHLRHRRNFSNHSHQLTHTINNISVGLYKCQNFSSLSRQGNEATVKSARLGLRIQLKGVDRGQRADDQNPTTDFHTIKKSQS